MNEALVKTLADLLMETGHAHHQAYIETDGADPDWPLWYADYLLDKLPPHLPGTTFTKTELVYLLVKLDKEQNIHAPGTNWPRWYAKYIVTNYA